jgi:hypothetical protein
MNNYEKFCVEEAEFHLRRAQDILTEGLKDPKKYYDERREFYKVMANVFPFIVLLQQCGAPQPPDQDEEGNLSDTQSSVGSSEGSYVPATP